MAASSKKQSPRKKEAEQKAGKKQIAILPAVIVIAIIIALAAVAYTIYSNYTQVNFSAFKANFNSASRVAVAVTYQNVSELPSLLSCSTTLVQVIAHSRNASTIDFFVLNSSTCTYSPTGIGHAINISSESSSSCLKIANSEPSIFLNASQSNSTTILPYHFYQYADQTYLQKCAIAVEFG